MDLGYCAYHETDIDDDALEKKDGRCLACQHFTLDGRFTTTREASHLLNKSTSTIRRWIRGGKLKAIKREGRLSIGYLEGLQIPTVAFEVYLIERESLGEV